MNTETELKPQKGERWLVRTTIGNTDVWILEVAQNGRFRGSEYLGDAIILFQRWYDNSQLIERLSVAPRPRWFDKFLGL